MPIAPLPVAPLPDAPLRVAHLGKYYPPATGGIESHVQTLAHAQARLGLAASVVAFRHSPGRSATEVDGPVSVTRLAAPLRVAKLDIAPDIVGTLRRLLSGPGRADVLHLHVPNPAFLLGLLAVGYRGSPSHPPLVVTYHSDHVRQRLTRYLIRPVEHWVYAAAAKIVCTSPVYAEGSDLLCEARYRGRLGVLPHGIDTRELRQPSPAVLAEAEQIRTRHAPPHWLSVGRLIYYKGLATAVRAMRSLPGTLLLVGGGPDRPSLESLARELGVADRVAFLGEVRQVAPYYLAATALLFPSNARSEAFGLVQVEAMAAGCPVVNTHIPHSGVPWVSPHELTGLTVAMDDPEALAGAGRRLLDEPGLRARLSAAGRARVAAEFEADVMARRSRDLYAEVLGQPPSQKLRGGLRS